MGIVGRGHRMKEAKKILLIILFWVWVFVMLCLGDYLIYVNEKSLTIIPQGAFEITIVFIVIGALIWLEK